MSDMTDLATAASAINDPETSAADLAVIAEVHPSLRTSVALHPAAYPGLLDWLDALGDPTLSAAVASRRASDARATVGPTIAVPETATIGATTMSGTDVAPNTTEQSAATGVQKVRMRIPLDSKAPLIAGIVLIIGGLPGVLQEFGIFGWMSVGPMYEVMQYTSPAVLVLGVALLFLVLRKRLVQVMATILVASTVLLIMFPIALGENSAGDLVMGFLSLVLLILAIAGIVLLYKGYTGIEQSKKWKTLVLILLGADVLSCILYQVLHSPSGDFWEFHGPTVIAFIVSSDTALLLAIALLVSSLSSDPSRKYYEPRPRPVKTPAVAVAQGPAPVPLYAMVVMPDGTQQMMPVAQPMGTVPISQSSSPADAPKRQVGMWEAYRRFWKRYAQFSGRASVKEYWWVVLAQVIVTLPVTALSVIGTVLLASGEEEGGLIVFLIAYGLLTLYGLAVLVPSLALLVRRLHDTNRAGPYMLMALIPLVGAIIVLVFSAQQGTVGTNMYGPDDSGN